MAVLTPDQLAELRTQILDGNVPGTWLKADFNTAIQEVEDALPAAFVDLKAAITNGTWTNSEKNKIVRSVIINRVLDLLGA